MNTTPTIYIVDDDMAVRAGVSLLVKACGWTPRPCASAEEFLQQYSRNEDGCIMLDMQMPGMSGADLSEMLTNLNIDLPVIVVTAYRNTALTERAKLAGAREILEKPFRDEVLISAIEAALDGR